MEVGQDQEFNSEMSSDEESNVVVLKTPEQKGKKVKKSKQVQEQVDFSEGEIEEEVEDPEFDWLLEENYERAGLKDDSSAEREQYIDLAVSKFQEVFMNSEFMETANKVQQQMQQQLKDSQKKIMEQTKELERVKRMSVTREKEAVNKGKSNEESEKEKQKKARMFQMSK